MVVVDTLSPWDREELVAVLAREGVSQEQVVRAGRYDVMKG